MKLLVVSDIHGSCFYAKKIEQLDKIENSDKIILLGDLYYNGSRNKLTEQYNSIEIAKVLNNLKHKILCIRGNCDTKFDEMISEFKFEDFIKLTVNGVKFFFTHGHKYNMNNVPKDIDVLVYGHLHTGFIQERYGKIFVNSGSIALPRNNTKNSFLIIDDNEIFLKDIEGNVIESIKINK